jgi:hypothetical protein
LTEMFKVLSHNFFAILANFAQKKTKLRM